MLDDLRSAFEALRGPQAVRSRLGFLAAVCFLIGSAILFFRLLEGAIGGGTLGFACALAVTILLAVAALFHLLLLFSRAPRPDPTAPSGLFGQEHFNYYAERFLEDRFGRTWRLLLAGASILTAVGLLVFNLDLYGFSKTKRSLEDELAGLRDRVTDNIRGSTIFVTDTLSRVTTHLEKNRVAIADRQLRRELGVDGFRLLEEQADLEFALGGLVEREHQILRESLEDKKGRDWVTAQRRMLAGFVDLLASEDRDRLRSPPPSRPDYAEPHIWRAEAFLRPVVPQRPDSSLLGKATGELRAALDALVGPFYGEEAEQEGAPDSVIAYRSFLRGKIAYAGGRLAFLTGRYCADLDLERTADKDDAICGELTETERRLRSFVRRRDLQVPTMSDRVASGLRQWMGGIVPEASYAPEKREAFREHADRLALDLFKEAESAWQAAAALEGGRVQPFLASIELWRGHLHYFAEQDAQAHAAYAEAIRKAKEILGASYPEAQNASAWARLTRSGAEELSKKIFEVIGDAYSALEASEPEDSSWYARQDTYARALSAAGLHYEAVSALYEGIGALLAVDSQDPRWSSDLRETRMREHCEGLFRTSLGERSASWFHSTTEAGNVLANALKHYAVYEAASREQGVGIDPEIAIKVARIHHIAGIRISTCADVLGESDESVTRQGIEHFCKADLLIRRAAAVRTEDIIAQVGTSAIAKSLEQGLQDAEESAAWSCDDYVKDVPYVRDAEAAAGPRNTAFLHRLRTRSDDRLEHFGLSFPKARMLNNEAWQFRTRHGECAGDALRQFEAAELAADAVTKRGFGGKGPPSIDSLLDTVARVAFCSPAHRTLGLAALERARAKGAMDLPEGEITAEDLAAAYVKAPPAVGAGAPAPSTR